MLGAGFRVSSESFFVASDSETGTELGAKDSKMDAAAKIVLVIVLIIKASSPKLLPDCWQTQRLCSRTLDMLRDLRVYGFSVYVLLRSAEWKAKTALLRLRRSHE